MAFDDSAIKLDNSSFLKFADKETRELYIAAGPRKLKLKVFVDGKPFEEGTPEFQREVATGEKPRIAYQFDVVDLSSDSKDLMIWEVSEPTYKQIKDVLAEAGVLSSLRVRRDGLMKKTRWAIMSGRSLPQSEAAELEAKLTSTATADPF